ncbi:hypothetical protein IFM89_036210 [Coptis chinensis]|uniref:Protein SPIRAL1-like 1 n=1 Tax=Coptis chinensis TaxID=261450 RepID=A0A835H2R1_9MAGN|nr:hypothetical protein IFM89_036210 [Coptis chinensis]
MGRGVSIRGGQSSLGYLFGSGEAPPPKPSTPLPQREAPIPIPAELVVPKKFASPPMNNAKQIPAGIQGSQANNYFRADGQNTDNFITSNMRSCIRRAPHCSNTRNQKYIPSAGFHGHISNQ